MHSPCHPAALRAVGGRLVAGLLLDAFDGRLSASTSVVDDCVPRDRVEPRGPWPALGPVAAGGAPDGCKRLLDGIFGATTVAEPPQRQAENRPRVALVQHLEGVAVARAEACDQLGVTDFRVHGLNGCVWRRKRQGRCRSRSGHISSNYGFVPRAD